MKSWSSIDKLSLKVFYDPKSKQYVGVFGQNIGRWDENTPDLNKIKKVSIHRKITFLVQNGDDGELLVLYSSGETESLSSAIKNRKTGGEESITSISLTDPNIFYCGDEKRILTFFEKDGTDVSIVISVLDPETLKTVSSLKYKISRGDIPLSAYSVIASGNIFEFISICKYFFYFI